MTQALFVKGFPDSSVGKESVCNAGDPGLIPGLGRSSIVGNGNPLQYSCLENFKDRGFWKAIVYEVTKSHMNYVQMYVDKYQKKETKKSPD